MRCPSCPLVLRGAAFCAALVAASPAGAPLPGSPIGIARAQGNHTRIEEVAVSGILGFEVEPAPRPSGAAFATLVKDGGGAGYRPARSKLLGFEKLGEPATVYYMEYGGETEAQAALPRLRAKLWGGDQPPPDGVRLLRASNIIAVVEAQTLAVTLAVSKGLLAAGAVQDGADSSPDSQAADPDASEAGEAGGELNLVAVGQPSAAEKAKVSDGLGRYLTMSAAAGQLLQDKQYAEALAAYRSYEQQVSADPAAGPLARWDAASGVGMAAGFSKNMKEAKAAFSRAVRSAAALDPRKLAETYFNKACAEAELRDKGAALADLQICLGLARKLGGERHAYYKHAIVTDPSLRSLRSDSRLKKMLAR